MCVCKRSLLLLEIICIEQSKKGSGNCLAVLGVTRQLYFLLAEEGKSKPEAPCLLFVTPAVSAQLRIACGFFHHT